MHSPPLHVLLRVAADDAEQWPDQHPKNVLGQPLANVHPDMLRQAADEIEQYRTRMAVIEAATVAPWSTEDDPAGPHPRTSETEKRSPGSGPTAAGEPGNAYERSAEPTRQSDAPTSLHRGCALPCIRCHPIEWS